MIHQFLFVKLLKSIIYFDLLYKLIKKQTISKDLLNRSTMTVSA